ncbi:MAG: hypothetical protein PUB98_06095 [Clostridiales bacterium]|nr:hypothetical protein [Clostridiales bacterium]
MEKVKGLIGGILFVVFLGMIIWGQRTVSYFHLGMMLVALAGLLGLLYCYNRKYR